MQTTQQEAAADTLAAALTAADTLAAALTAADVPAEHIGAGIIETWIDVTDGEYDGSVRLHVDAAGTLAAVVITFYDPADTDQPGRPVEDEDVAEIPVGNVAGILQTLRTLADEHGAT
jgi:hypothetical protein